MISFLSHLSDSAAAAFCCFSSFTGRRNRKMERVKSLCFVRTRIIKYWIALVRAPSPLPNGIQPPCSCFGFFFFALSRRPRREASASAPVSVFRGRLHFTLAGLRLAGKLTGQSKGPFPPLHPRLQVPGELAQSN